MSFGPLTARSETAEALTGTLKRTVLQQSASSIPGWLIVQVPTEIPACVESGWHIHPGEEVGYILAGTIQMSIEDRPTLVLHAGDPFLIPPRVPHNALDLGPDTGRMLSTHIVEPGQPLATLTPAETGKDSTSDGRNGIRPDAGTDSAPLRAIDE